MENGKYQFLKYFLLFILLLFSKINVIYSQTNLFSKDKKYSENELKKDIKWFIDTINILDFTQNKVYFTHSHFYLYCQKENKSDKKLCFTISYTFYEISILDIPATHYIIIDTTKVFIKFNDYFDTIFFDKLKLYQITNKDIQYLNRDIPLNKLVLITGSVEAFVLCYDNNTISKTWYSDSMKIPEEYRPYPEDHYNIQIQYYDKW
jgi:hypothetical protein